MPGLRKVLRAYPYTYPQSLGILPEPFPPTDKPGALEFPKV